MSLVASILVILKSQKRKQVEPQQTVTSVSNIYNPSLLAALQALLLASHSGVLGPWATAREET